MLSPFASRRRFSDLSEAEILALAISSEEDDARIYATYAEQLRHAYPSTAEMFDAMAAEEDGHRRLLIDTYERRFGKVIPLIRREHVAGFYSRRPVWLVQNLGLDRIRRSARASPPPASCSAISPPPNASTSTRRKRSRRRRRARPRAATRTRKRAGNSFSPMCSRGWPA
jgi:hypothetical protein